jgi:putative membrane protein
MMFFSFFILIAIVIGIWYFTNQGNFEDWKPGKKETPLDTLKRRYAEGEISTEEYEERKKVLEQEDFF